jgi:hypothetical protein
VCTGAHAYTTTYGNKSIIVDKIKHIFIVFVLPTKSILNIKNMPYTTYIDWHGTPILAGPRATSQRAHD